MSKKPLAGLVGLLALASMSLASPALAGNWGPANDKALLDSTNLVFEVEGKTGSTEKLTCEATDAEGTLGAASSKFGTTPHFSHCTVKAVGTGEWKAIDISSTQANLEIPANGAEIEVGAGCKLNLSAQIIGSAGDYTNGVNARLEPSVWQFTSTTVTIKESTVGCFNSVKNVTTGKISLHLVVQNLTPALGSALEPIKVS